MSDLGTHVVRIDGTDDVFEVHVGEPLLGAARRAGVWLPFECGWGGCGTCKATVVSGETELLYAAPSVHERDARRRRVPLCQTTAVTDLVIKPVRCSHDPDPDRPVRDHEAVLVAHEELGPELCRFRFELDAPASYRPGQHAILHLGEGLHRCYSMAGLPGTRQVSFIAKRYAGHPGSERLFALPVGTTIECELPYGDTYLRDVERPSVLIAGGTGISAILALTLQLAGDAWAERGVHVFYGAGRRDELVCIEELSDAVSSIPGGRLHPVLLDPPAGWQGGVGFVTQTLAAELPSIGDAEFYLTGPPPMTNATLAVLREAGVGLDRVHYDSFG